MWTIPCTLLFLSGSIINLGRGYMQMATGKRWIIFTWSHFLWEWQWHSMGLLAVMGSFAGYECRMNTPTRSLSLSLAFFLFLYDLLPFRPVSLWPPVFHFFPHSCPTLFPHFVCFISVLVPLYFSLAPPNFFHSGPHPRRFERGHGPCLAYVDFHFLKNLSHADVHGETSLCSPFHVVSCVRKVDSMEVQSPPFTVAQQKYCYYLQK